MGYLFLIKYACKLSIVQILESPPFYIIKRNGNVLRSPAQLYYESTTSTRFSFVVVRNDGVVGSRTDSTSIFRFSTILLQSPRSRTKPLTNPHKYSLPTPPFYACFIEIHHFFLSKGGDAAAIFPS